ncbi:methyltransferase domain-containing protein [Nocardioides conyzicola]|uniref:Class I SAM-dependent methyltransferase n=1 Tax=Nocardioides conyzicola TaxID=1651781 RepID=A0ABP8Y625_9ACTN
MPVSSPRRAVARALVRAARTVDATALPQPTPPPRRPPGPRGPAPAGRCLVCHSPRVRRQEVAFVDDPELRKTVNACRRCGYVAIDELPNDLYRGKSSVDELPPPTSRMGTEDRTGREFEMARMALDILGRRKPQDVLVYGAGRSLDNLHIQRLPGVGEVAIADIMKVRDDAPFVDPNEPGARRFPIVIASEVVEHFRDPWPDFATMARVVGPRGLLVCGTNVHSGRPRLQRHRYLFYPDHTSYYSAESLRQIATRLGFHIDFRLPEGLGTRKRYVLLSRSPEVLARAATYFGRVGLAPSEVTERRREAAAAAAG